MIVGAENTTESNQSQVRRILQSKTFRTSEVHRNLLHYLSEKSLSGEADSLKEYTVGLDLFSKPASYDPRQESVVRMHMARLRQKLAEYYRTEGADDPIIVDLPKGGFKVIFEARPARVEAEPLSRQAIPLPQPTYRRELVLGALLVVALAIASYLGWKLQQAGNTGSTTGWTNELQELWSPLLSQDRPLVLVLATREDAKTTALSTANGAFQLGQFLADRRLNVYVTGSDELSMPDVIMGNLVFLGSTASNRQLQAMPVSEELVKEPGGIRIVHPAAGEPGFLPNPPPRTAQSTVDEGYSLITLTAGVNGKGDVLYLDGSLPAGPMAGVEAFTEPSVAAELVAKLRKPDGSLPRYYQILLKVRSMDDTPIDITYVLHKEIPGK